MQMSLWSPDWKAQHWLADLHASWPGLRLLPALSWPGAPTCSIFLSVLLSPATRWELWGYSRKAARTGTACKMQWVKLILQETLLRRRVLVVFPGMAEKYISRINTVAWLTKYFHGFHSDTIFYPNIKSPNSYKLIWIFLSFIYSFCCWGIWIQGLVSKSAVSRTNENP